MRRISDEALIAIRRLHERRDKEATILGAIFIDFELKRAGIQLKYAAKVDELHLRIGALVTEFEHHKSSALDRIRDSLRDEKEIESKALWTAGVNPEAIGDHKIDMDNGVILLLKEDGRFVPME